MSFNSFLIQKSNKSFLNSFKIDFFNAISYIVEFQYCITHNGDMFGVEKIQSLLDNIIENLHEEILALHFFHFFTSHHHLFTLYINIRIISSIFEFHALFERCLFRNFSIVIDCKYQFVVVKILPS